MIFYRLALVNRQKNMWNWKSTALNSLHAVFQLLNLYSFLPQDRIRVFTARSKEDLDEMLSRENANQVSGSVTAAQFLQERRLHVHELPQGAARQEMGMVRRPITATLDWSAGEDHPASQPAAASSLHLLDKRRLEIEQGPGGDHDSAYRFSLPASTPQMLAWTRLMVRVRAVELEL